MKKRTFNISSRDGFKGTMETVARRGDRLVYHRGFLWADRTKGWSKLTVGARKILNELAKDVWAAYKKGLVALVQRRTDQGCEYIAVKL